MPDFNDPVYNSAKRILGGEIDFESLCMALLMLAFGAALIQKAKPVVYIKRWFWVWPKDHTEEVIE